MNPLSDEQRARFDAFDRDRERETEEMIERLGLEGAQAEDYRNHGKHWILMPDGEVVAVSWAEALEWGEREFERRIVGRDEVMAPGGRIFRVSTVFLGIDHSFGMGGGPVLFETMIFDDVRINKRLDDYRDAAPRLLAALRGEDVGEPLPERPSIKYDGWQMRYRTLREAQAGHKLTIQMVQEGGEDWPQ